MKIEQVTKDLSKLGEGPHWAAEEQCLYFVDIMKQQVCRYDERTGVVTRATVAGTTSVSFILPVKDKKDMFLIGAKLKIALIKWNGKDEQVEIEKTIAEINDHPEGTINDGKVDPVGRLYAGTIAKMDNDLSNWTNFDGVVFSYSPNESLLIREKKIGIANGLAWNREKGKFYYVDSVTYNLREYDYDEKTGQLSNCRIVIDIRDEKHNLPKGCFMDGITIDTAGNIWIALYRGSSVIQVNPESGEIIQKVDVPVFDVTSVAWGGKNLDVLYITTGALPDEKGVSPPSPAGGLFKASGLNARGLEASLFNL